MYGLNLIFFGKKLNLQPANSFSKRLRHLEKEFNQTNILSKPNLFDKLLKIY